MYDCVRVCVRVYVCIECEAVHVCGGFTSLFKTRSHSLTSPRSLTHFHSLPLPLTHTETARAQQLAADVGAAKQAEKDALAKLAAVKSALEAEQQLAAKRGGQVSELASQVESLKSTLGSVSRDSRDSQALNSLTAQLSERDDKISVSWLLLFCF